ncbi:hypothetical protein LINPERHAP1_LOCUS21014 [Linum perenne]
MLQLLALVTILAKQFSLIWLLRQGLGHDMLVCASRLISLSHSSGNISSIIEYTVWNMKVLKIYVSLMVFMGIRETDVQPRKMLRRLEVLMWLPQRRLRLPKVMLVVG